MLALIVDKFSALWTSGIRAMVLRVATGTSVDKTMESVAEVSAKAFYILER